MDDIIKKEADRFNTFLSVHMARLEDKGYSREEIVALDFNDASVIFYMTSGDIVRIPTTQATFVSGDENIKH